MFSYHNYSFMNGDPIKSNIKIPSKLLEKDAHMCHAVRGYEKYELGLGYLDVQ